MHRKLSISLQALSIIGLLGSVLYLVKKNRANPFNIFDSTKFAGLKKFIIAQSKVESGNYTSPLFLRSNNAFGMKNAEFRQQLGYRVPGDQYRHYNSLLESIQDFELYLNSVNFPPGINSPEAYAGQLKRLGYFEAPLNDYTQALKSWI